MKKLLLLVALVATTAMGAFAQTEKGEKSVIGQLGAQTDPGRFMLGIQGRYNIIDNVRIAPDVMFMFPKDKVTGLDVNVNVHYVLPVVENVTVYPLAGIAMLNNRYSGKIDVDSKKESHGYTDFGFNLGGGASYNISDNNYVNLELKYTFSDNDHFTMGIGYGFKF